jgi:hypothetical protein
MFTRERRSADLFRIRPVAIELSSIAQEDLSRPLYHNYKVLWTCSGPSNIQYIYSLYNPALRQWSNRTDSILVVNAIFYNSVYQQRQTDSTSFFNILLHRVAGHDRRSGAVAHIARGFKAAVYHVRDFICRVGEPAAADEACQLRITCY